MRFLAAFDKFKDALSAREVCSLARSVLEDSILGAEVFESPMTDGGEGFSEILTHALGGRFSSFSASGPLGETVQAKVGFVDSEVVPEKARKLASFPLSGDLAVIEMASVAGLQQVPVDSRDPWRTSSTGVGQVFAQVLKKGVSAILLGIGGSATNDLGLGALHSLGLRFFDSKGNDVGEPIPCKWPQISSISGEVPTMPPISIACDVENSLCGANGATFVYGPQKGLEFEDLSRMDDLARRMSRLLADKFGKDPSGANEPRAGAAGGMGFGIKTAFDARFVSGFELVSAWLGLEEKILKSDVVLSGEGRFDASSLDGKGPALLLEMAQRRGKRVFLIAGSIQDDLGPVLKVRIPGLKTFSVSCPDLPLSENLQRSREFFEQTLRNIVQDEGWPLLQAR